MKQAIQDHVGHGCKKADNPQCQSDSDSTAKLISNLEIWRILCVTSL